MKILGIETSCDETAAAIVKDGIKILSSVVSSSKEIHKKYGGIVPEQAAREQIKCIIPVIQEVIENCKLKIENLDAIAVTVGPGLIGSLLVGVETAKTLSFVWKKPIVPINHLIAHIYANFINYQSIQFPAVCLVVSGGHTELVLMRSHGEFKYIGGTRDDAAGECFDKCARLLGLGYPGGPAIEKKAKKLNSLSIIHYPLSIKLPRPMINADNFDFSFSGLKTAVFYLLHQLQSKQSKNSFSKTNSKTNPQKLHYFKDDRLLNNVKSYLAKEIQEAITDILVEKTLKAAKKFKVKSILIGGGVAANSRLREKFQSSILDLKSSIRLFIPDKKLCTDNAAIVASTAFFNYKPVNWSKIKPNPSLEII